MKALLITTSCIIVCGCAYRPGHLRTKGFTYRHSSIEWVYHTGSQLTQPLIQHFLLAPTWPFPARMQSEILDLRAGEECVIVTEGLPLVYERHLSIGVREVRLDLATGDSTSCRPTEQRRSPRPFDRSAATACSSDVESLHFADIGDGLTLCSGCWRYPYPLCVGQRSEPVEQWLVLADWEASLHPWDAFGLLYDEMGPVSNPLRLPGNKVVVSVGLLSVVCVDLDFVPSFPGGKKPQ